jgi:hypothetical protein
MPRPEMPLPAGPTRFFIFRDEAFRGEAMTRELQNAAYFLAIV